MSKLGEAVRKYRKGEITEKELDAALVTARFDTAAAITEERAFKKLRALRGNKS